MFLLIYMTIGFVIMLAFIHWSLPLIFAVGVFFWILDGMREDMKNRPKPESNHSKLYKTHSKGN